MCAVLLLLLAQQVAARANGASQCNVPATKSELNGMGGRTFTEAYTGTQAVIGTPATANAGQAYTITLSSAGNILGVLVNTMQGGAAFGTFSFAGKIKMCAGGSASTATHNAVINAASVPLTFNIPAGASGQFTINALMLIGASGDGDNQNFYSLTKTVTIASAATTTKATPAPTTTTRQTPAPTTTTKVTAPQPTPVRTQPPPTPTAASPTPVRTQPPPTPGDKPTTGTTTDPCPALSTCTSCLGNSFCKWCPVAGSVGCTLNAVPCGGSIREAQLCSTPGDTTARVIPTLPANSVPDTTSQMVPGTDADGHVLSCEPGWTGCACKGGGGGLCNHKEASCQDGMCLITGCVRGKLGCGCKNGNACDEGVCNGGFCSMMFGGHSCSLVGGEAGCYCTPSHNCVDEGAKCIGGLLCGFSGSCYAGDAGCKCAAGDSCRDADFVECRETKVLSKTKMLVAEKYCLYKKPQQDETQPLNSSLGVRSTLALSSTLLILAAIL